MNALSLMAQEAAEAPEVVARIVAARDIIAPVLAEIERRKPEIVLVCARGSSGHAGVFLRYLVETRLALPVSAVAPSVFSTFRRPMRLSGALFVAISQSGGSPDLVAACAAARRGGALTLALVNAAASPLAAVAELTLPLAAGPERSVAATKSVIASMALSARLVGFLSGDDALAAALGRLPSRLQEAATLDWSGWTRSLAGAGAAFVSGRGFGYAPAREIALKLSEALGLPALAYSAAELRHGPRAAVSASTPVLLLQVADETAATVAKLADDLSADGAPVFRCGGNGGLPWIGDDHSVADAIAMLAPAYGALERAARDAGRDPDRPPRLSKVTLTL